ncbi:MAG: glycosyltransferase family 2 protein [Syntrophales bacterium]|nr:glycosyltransferase family 2 protein [Syntrophales bacterium]
MPSVAIFVPVYNEEKILSENVVHLMSYLDGVLPGYEIIIVSNGSTDSTVEIGEKLATAYPEITFSHTHERGVGHAFRRGVSLARADRIIAIDADLTTDADFIPRACKLLDTYDIVIGSKKRGIQERSAVRIMGSDLFILFARVLLGLPYGDYSIGAKAYRREVIMRYLDCVGGGSSYVIDIIYRSWRDRARIIEAPVRCSDTRKSHFNLVHEGIYRFYRLFGLWFGK